MRAHDEWVRLSRALLDEEPELQEAIGRFRAPGTPAGNAAERWLKDQAGRLGWIQTYVLLRREEVAAFHGAQLRRLFRALFPDG